ncbi:MAG: hypothetical protein M3O30_02840 [Planctomycetota bacterium]|nr:hypothetical protein [Planctomycetota bacterium]
MQRIAQRLFTGIAMLLLMLCLVATFFWVRVRAVNDEIYMNLSLSLGNDTGTCMVAPIPLLKRTRPGIISSEQ